MASKSGANTGFIIKPYLVYDTPSAPSTNDKIKIDSEALSRNSTELTENPIGGNVIMKTTSEIGDDDPGGPVSKTLRTNDAFNAALMNFMGTETVTNVNSAAVVYEHSAVANTTSIVNYLLMAKETSTATLAEFKNALLTDLALEYNVNDFVKANGTFKASQRLITGTTSSNATIQAATEPTNYPFVFRDVDYFWVNAQAGAALTSSDVLNITKASVTLSRPMEYVDEARGTAGKAAPRVSGEPPFLGSITVTCKEKDADTFFTAYDAGTEYKATLRVQGPIISGSYRHFFRIDFPRLKIVTEPQYNLSSASVNPYTIEFQCMAALSNPTGMNTTYPFFCLANDRSTKYLA